MFLFSDQACYNVPKSHSEPVRKEKVVKELTGELNVAKLEAMVSIFQSHISCIFE